MSVTEVSHQSWFGRMKAALGGIVVGLILTVVAFPVLWLNEGRAVKTAKGLKEGAAVVKTVDPGVIQPENEGELVHFTGMTTVEGGVSDDLFGIEAEAVKLSRIVEMYQWKEEKDSETEKKLGGGTETVTTFSYRKVWDDDLIDSTRFKDSSGYENPMMMPFENRTDVAQVVRVGAFRLPDFLVGKIQAWSSLPAPPMERLPEDIRARAKPSGGALYFGENPDSPKVGDVRVTFRIIKPQDVSVVATQVGQTLDVFRAKSGATVSLLQTGAHTAEAMFEQAESQNRMVTWLLRLLGFVLMVIGIGLVLRPMSVFADVVPMFGNLVGAGTGFVAFLLAGALSAVTIGLAWMAHRPLIAVPLFALTLVFVILAVRRLAARRAAA